MTTTETQSTNLPGGRRAELDFCSHSVVIDDSHVPADGRDDHALLQALLDVRHLLAAEWSLDVLTVLQPGSLRYTELLDTIRTLQVVDRRTGRRRYPQTRTFIGTLRRMEAIGLVHRSELAGVWPREVHYGLTEFACDLMLALSPTVTWHGRYENELPLGRQHA